MPQVGLCELEAGLALAAFAGESGRSGRNRITSCLRTTRPESSGSEGRDTTAGMEGQPRKCWASLRSVCRTKVAEESCGHPSCFLGQCDLPGGGRGAMELAGSSALLLRYICHGSTGRCDSSVRDHAQ